MASPTDDLASIASGFQPTGASAPVDSAPAPTAPDGDLSSIAAGFTNAPTTTPIPSAPKPPSAPPQQHHAPTQFQKAAMPSDAPELSWGDVGKQALSNALPSLGGVASSIGHAVMHPGQTIQGIENLGTGLALQAADKLGYTAKPEYQAQASQALNVASALENHFGQYGSVKGIKKALATDPAGVALDASTLLGGAGAGADAAGLAKTGAALGSVGSAIDPISNAVRIASAPVKLLSNPVTREIQHVTTGVPSSLLKVAQQAGETTDPVLRDAFLRHFNGQGTAGEFLQSAQKALGALKQSASDDYLAGKGQLVNDPVNFANTYSALDDADKELGMGAAAGFPQAKAAIQQARDYVDSVSGQADPAARNLVNADALKQQIWDLRDSVSNSKGQQFLGKVYNGIKSDISDVDPAYQTLMENYQDGLNNLTDITKTFGLGRNPAASAALAKSLRSLNKGSGENVLQQLATVDPELPFMMAGSALSPWSAGGARNILEAGVSLPWAVAMHNPAPLIMQAAAQSPKVAGMANYAAGAAGRAGAAAAQSPVARGAYYAGRVGQEQDSPSQPTAQAAPVGNYAPTDIDAATRMVMAEAGNQPDQGKLAALYTAINRARASGKPLSSVIAQPYAYEGVTNGNAAKIDPNSPQYQAIRDNIVLPALSGQAPDPTNGMTHFINKKLQTSLGRHIPKWAQGEGLDIGQHTFFSANGGRIGRAAGGKVRSHEELVQRLMMLAEQAKKTENKKTKPLLNVPDNTVVKALDIAQRAI